MIEIDLSPWRVDDELWVSRRKLEWEVIAGVLDKNQKGLLQVKFYHSRGKLPDWVRMESWDDAAGHLDLFSFLWLHPSKDFQLLDCLAKKYISSSNTLIRDIKSGYDLFKFFYIDLPRRGNQHDVEVPYLLEKADVIFEVLFKIGRLEFVELLRGKVSKNEASIFYRCNVRVPGYDSFEIIRSWLEIKSVTPVNELFIYQSPYFLEWWYYFCLEDGVNYFWRCGGREKDMESFFVFLLGCGSEEGMDECQVSLVRLIIDMLDRNEFMPEQKALWLEVKSRVVAS